MSWVRLQTPKPGYRSGRTRRRYSKNDYGPEVLTDPKPVLPENHENAPRRGKENEPDQVAGAAPGNAPRGPKSNHNQKPPDGGHKGHFACACATIAALTAVTANLSAQ